MSRYAQLLVGLLGILLEFVVIKYFIKYAISELRKMLREEFKGYPIERDKQSELFNKFINNEKNRP